MTIAALLLAVAAAAAPAAPAAAGAGPPPPRGVQIASSQVTATILRPAIVRQASGVEQGPADAPRPQITRRGREVLAEYQ